MTVSFVDVFEANKEISLEEINYVIPYSGKLVIKDVSPDSCVLNHKLIHHDSIFELPVKQDDIILSCGSDTIRIKILKGELSQESIIDYQDIYKQYLIYANNGCFDYQDMLKAFDIKNTEAIKLCSFNKKFANLLQSSNRDEILKDVKYLPHIFYRPKLHLKQVEEVRPASIVTRIGTESIRHLASHSEHWKGIKANGLIPERLLARILEDDYAIYENVAAKTIVDRIYALEKKEKEDTIDCKMNFSLSESYSLGGERPNFFNAIQFLFEGFKNSESSTTQKLIEETLKVINSILEYLSKCKSTNLYRHIRKEKKIRGPLKKTNIFMMDNYYKKVYQLWELLGKKEEISDILEKKELQEEYLLYVELIILFCLKYMGFKPEEDDEILLSNNLFNHCRFSFEDWEIVLNTEKAKIFDGFITAEITQKNNIPVHFSIDLPDSSVYHQFKATKSGNEIIFEKKLEESEQIELCNLLQEKIEKKQQGLWKQGFRKILHDSMMKVSFNKETILFIPWKYGIADDYKMAKETLDKIGELIPNGFDECYILNITRPNELRSINDEALLNSLVSYSVRNQDSNKGGEFGIIPVSLNDVNSFRRLSKIFLKNMITIKSEQNYCPQCGSKLKGDKIQGYFCMKQDCNFKIYNSQCPDCKKKYWYTDYILPTTFGLDSESLGLKILLDENKLGFKNITTLNEHKPECPYCKRTGDILISKGNYSIEKYIIETEKKNNYVTNSTSINKRNSLKKPLVTGIVNFVNPLDENVQTKMATQKSKTSIIPPKNQNTTTIVCPYCNKYSRTSDKSLLYHLTKQHAQQASRIDNLIVFSKGRVICPKCQKELYNCSDEEIILHIRKKCSSIQNNKPLAHDVQHKTIKMSDETLSSKLYCPCCGCELKSENYTSHLKLHISDNSYKILSKNLGKTSIVLCPWCKKSFQKTESNLFLNHIKEKHLTIYDEVFNLRNGLPICKKCKSIVAGVHPAIIIQHVLGGC